MTTSTSARSLILDDRKRELAALIRDCTRHLRASAHLSRADRHLLDSVSRTSSSYGFSALDHLCRIAATCSNDAHALAIPEAIRGFVLSHRTERPRVGFFPATMHETQANADADMAQLRCLHEWGKPRLDCLVEALGVQEATTRRLIDEAHLERASLGATFTLVR